MLNIFFEDHFDIFKHRRKLFFTLEAIDQHFLVKFFQRIRAIGHRSKLMPMCFKRKPVIPVKHNIDNMNDSRVKLNGMDWKHDGRKGFFEHQPHF